MTETSARTVNVAGLVMRHTIRDARVSDPILGGPAIVAALGCRLMGTNTRLLTMLPGDLTADDEEVLRYVDPDLKYVSRSNQPALHLVSPAMLCNAEDYQLIGNPSSCKGGSRIPDDAEITIFANGDPSWYSQIIRLSNVRSLAIDLHANWLPFRESDILQCLKRASLVTLTERELSLLSLGVLKESNIGEEGGASAIVKRGANGVRIRQSGKYCDLRAPETIPIHDVGAGDFLIGLIVGQVLSVDDFDFSLDNLTSAYLRALPLLSEFLESESPQGFIRRKML